MVRNRVCFQYTILIFSCLFLNLSCALAPKVAGVNTDGPNIECTEAAPSKIINGRKVKIEESISKEAVLILTKRNEKLSSCTGVPISSKIILTAAHCLQNATASNVSVVFHTDTICSNGYSAEKNIVAEKIILHPDFDGTPNGKADLAIIKLQRTIPSDYQVASFYDGSTKVSSDDVELLGYGITDERKSDSMVLRTTRKSFSKDLYIKSPLILFNQTNDSGGFCRGDSGAPVYIYTGGIKKIIGINSFNIEKSKNTECHTASAAMYIPFFKNWILKEVINL